jgi:hypothetical protein
LLAAVLVLGLRPRLAQAQDTLVVSVKTDSGRPLPDALVSIANPRYGQHWTRATTDSAGIARLEPAPRDSFTLEVRHIGYERSRFPMRDTSAAVTVVMKRAAVQLTEVCLTYALPAISLQLDSAITSGRTRIVARVRDGSFFEVDSLDVPSERKSLAFAWERVGTYDIEITAGGYKRWSRSDVRVTKDRCHVVPQVIRVRLRPRR